MMKNGIMFGLFALISITACLSPKTESAKNKKGASANELSNSGVVDFSKFDTLEKIYIDTILDRIHKEISTLGAPQKIPYTVYNPTDTIYFWTLSNDAARISLEVNMPNGIVWPVYYVNKGELVFVRYRYFLNEPPNSNARESMVYLQQSKVVYCEERSQQMVDGEMPAGLKQKPFNISTRTVSEIEEDYSAYWQIILNQMKENNSLPTYLEKFLTN